MGVYDYDGNDTFGEVDKNSFEQLLNAPVTPYAPPEPVDNDSEFSKGVKRGVEGLKSAAYGAAGLAGSALGIDSLRDFGYEGFLEHEEEAAKHAGRVQGIEDIKGIGDAVDWAAGTAGSLVPSIGEAAVTATAGGIIGSTVGPEGTIAGGVGGLVGKQAVKSMIRKLAKEYVKDGMEKGVARKAAKEAVESLGAKALYKNLGTKAGIVAGTAPIEAGGMWGEGMQEGKDNPYSAAVFGTLSGLSELLGGEAELIDVFTNPARLPAKGNVIKRIGVELGKTIPQEALQEATQETLAIINRKVVDPSYDMFGEDARSRVLNSAAAGALGGVAFGGIGGVMSGESRSDQGPGTEESDNLDPRSSNLEPDISAEDMPPHAVTEFEAAEQPVAPPEPKGTLERAADLIKPAPTVPGIGDVAASPVVDASVPGIGGAAPTKTSDELVLDEARGWASGQIKAGNTSLMKQFGEPESAYAQRLVRAFGKRKAPKVNNQQSEPKYVNVFMVNPETGKTEIVRPEEVADRLRNGWRTPEASAAVADDEDTELLAGITAADKSLLRSARERADYWERGSLDNGHSNKTELFPWLADWGKTTPAEVGRAVDNFLAGKKLGDVQQRLVAAALKWERDNRQARGAAPVQGIGDLVAERRGVKGRNEERGTRNEEKKGLDPEVLRKAKRYAEKTDLDIGEWTDEDISKFVSDYERWVNSKSRATAPVATIGDLVTQRRAMTPKIGGKGGKKSEAPGKTGTEGSDNSQETAEGMSTVRNVDGQHGDGVSAVQQTDGQEIDQEAHEAATSPSNELSEPSQAQIEAGNYKKGHVKMHGLDISIENPKGSMRRGVDENGKAWETKLAHHYGYIKGTVGKDKDHVDVFIGPDTASQRVFVVDQVDPASGKLDEHKVLFGFPHPLGARLGYLANYDKSGKERIGAITETTPEGLREWLADGDQKKPFGEVKDGLSELQKEERGEKEKVSPVRGETVESQAEGERLKAEGQKAKIVEKLKAHVDEETAGKIADLIADEYAAKKKMGPAWLGKRIKEGWVAKWKLQAQLKSGEKNAEDLTPEEIANLPVAKKHRPVNATLTEVMKGAERDSQQGKTEKTEKAEVKSYAQQMQEAETADEGRGIIKRYTAAYAAIEKSAGLENTIRTGGSGVAYRGYSTLTSKEKNETLKKVLESSKELAEKLKALIKDIDASAPYWEALLEKEMGGYRMNNNKLPEKPTLPLSSIHQRMKEITGHDTSPRNSELEREFLEENGNNKILDLTPLEFEKRLNTFIEKKKAKIQKGQESGVSEHELVEQAKQIIKELKEVGQVDFAMAIEANLSTPKMSLVPSNIKFWQQKLNQFKEQLGTKEPPKETRTAADAILNANDYYSKAYKEYTKHPEANKELVSAANAIYQKALETLNSEGFTFDGINASTAKNHSNLLDLKNRMSRLSGSLSKLASSHMALLKKHKRATIESVQQARQNLVREISSLEEQLKFPATNEERPAEAAPPASYGEKNTIFTKDKADRARETLRKKLSQLNAGLDPELIQAGIDLAGYHIEAGARSFTDYSKRMIADLGDAISPYLKSFYLAVRNYPGFDNAGMDSEAQVEKQAGAKEKPSGLFISEKQITNPAKNIVKLLNGLGLMEKVFQGEDFHTKLENDPYIPLVIERHNDGKNGDPRLYFTHYVEQNGDQVLDGEMVWRVSPQGMLVLDETAVPNALLGGEFRLTGKKSDNRYAAMFAKNLLDQGWAKVKENTALPKPATGDKITNEINPTKTGGEAGVERSDADLERNSGNAKAANSVGEEDLSDDGRGDNQGVRQGSRLSEDEEFEPGRDPVLPRSEALTPGEHGNPEIQRAERQAESAERAARSEFGERSGDFDVTRERSEPVATAAVERAAARNAELTARQKAQEAAQDVPVVAGDRANIEKSLPILHPGQREDVAIAEDRFAKPDGYGVMFTNGTGTGKTFSGLGIVKRFERQGKENILIVGPSDNVINGWIQSGKKLLLDITPLSGIKDSGSGIVITTYENFGQNETLCHRDWDLVLFDESHKLNSNKDGNPTNAQNMMQAVTLYPGGIWNRTRMLNPELSAKIDKARQDKDWDQVRKFDKQWHDTVEKVRNDVMGRQGEQRTRVVFLSATPFAYEKNIEYANGYLFDYNEGQGDESQRSGYNSGDNRERFFMTHFGYRMRYNKLTEPPAEVDRGIMQRQFNSWLKSKGVLSGRMLEVEPDYDRRFILVDSAIGGKIDEGLEFLRENDEFRPIYDHVIKKFDYLSRRFLLEAIKAKEVLPHVHEHLALGRKVVIFHDYNQGGGINPFNVNSLLNRETEVYTGTYPNQVSEKLGDVAARFVQARPDLVNLPFGRYGSALDTLRTEFPDALVVNGRETKKNNLRAEALFQDDDSGKDIIIVQADKGKEGISLHDTTGRHQRVEFNLGLPEKPTMAIQQEGRIYRDGQVSDAIMRYLNTGTNWERYAFATKIARRASTAENLASGEQARMLLDAFVQAFEESDDYRAGHEGEGTGGKERDKAASQALTEWDRAITYYFGQQKKTSRNKAREGVDYFATPEPLGLKMVEWADIRPGDSVLEPSGGHGAIARWFPDQSRRRMIEPSLELSSRAALIFDGDIVQGRFEDHNVVNKYDAIVMNPPFGSGGRTAVDHLEKAAQHLKDGGRIVAIIPRGPAADKKFDKWMDGEEMRPLEPIGRLEDGTEIFKGDTVVYQGFPTGPSLAKKEFETVVHRIDGNFFYSADKDFPGINLVAVDSVKPTGKREAKVKNDLLLAADINLPSIAFERAGTKVAARVVVLDRAKDVYQSSRDYSDAGTIKEFFDRIEGSTIPERQIVQPVEAEKTETPAPVKTEGGVTLGVFNHTKTGKPLYVATLNDRLDKAAYSTVNAIAKKHKGYYNSYAKGGAIKGFIFDSEANRDSFVAEVLPDNEQAAHVNEPVKFAASALPISSGLPVAEIREAFEPIYKNMPNSPPWRVVQTAAELPKRALDDAAKRGIPKRLLQAVYLGNEVVYVADNFRSMEEAKQVILEEVVVHHGLRGILPKDAYEKHMRRTALWYANKRTDEWKALAKQYGLDLKTDQGRIEAAEEMLGRDARTGKDSTALTRIIAAVKEFLRGIGWDLGYGEAEIRELLGKARRFVEGKESPAAIPQPRSGGIDYGALLRTLKEQGISDAEIQAFAAYEPEVARYAAAWHGSPHDFEKFLKEKIGTGEGNQAYGYGLYFAGKKGVAEWYKKILSRTSSYEQAYDSEVLNAWRNFEEQHPKVALGFRDDIENYAQRNLSEREFAAELQNVHFYAAQKQQQRIGDQAIVDSILKDSKRVEYDPAGYAPKKKGSLYKVELAPGEDEYLLWDKQLSEQSERVREALSNAGIMPGEKSKTRYLSSIENEEARALAEDMIGREENRLFDDNAHKDWDTLYKLAPDIDHNLIHDIQEEIKEAGDGARLYWDISNEQGDDKAASSFLHSIGIRGIKYLDGSSRGVNFHLEWTDGRKDIGNAKAMRYDAESAMLLKNEDIKAAIEYLREKGKTEAAEALERGDLVQNGPNYNYVIFDDSDVSITAKFALARLEDVKNQIVEKGVSLNTAEREVLEADRTKTIEAIETTVRDYDEPGRYLFRAFYESDQEQSPGVVPYNPERGHYAAGEELKGSWWTTSYTTAQEIAWSKGRNGKPVKIVALPLNKLPKGKFYIQNTNPPGFVYDLFVGLPADVAMADVQEMPVDTGIRYALAEPFAAFTEQFKRRDALRNLAKILNPFDWSRAKQWIEDVTPQNIRNGAGSFLRNPIFEAEADEKKRPFVQAGILREKTKLDYLLRFLGWDGPAVKVPGVMERLKKTYSQWETSDRTTEWGRITDTCQKLSEADRKSVDLLLYRGDLLGKVYKTYEMVTEDKRTAKVTKEAFEVYQQVRTHIDTVVADAVEDLSRQFMYEAGLDEQTIEKHLTDYRNRLAERPGWLPRNHGEGDYQVNVYHIIRGLKWETRKGKDTMQALLPYYPSKEVAEEIKKLADRYGLKYTQLPNGQQLITTDKNATANFKKKIEKLQEKIAATDDEKEKSQLEAKLSEAETAKIFAESLPADQISRFTKKTVSIFNKLWQKNELGYLQRKKALDQAIADGESTMNINALKDELRKYGDGKIKVKVYMRLQQTKTRAKRHKAEVDKDLRKAIPYNFREKEQYETEYHFANQLTEEMYGDMKNDFAVEQAQLEAITRAAKTGEISKDEAAALRQKILQSTAEVLMARGAGAHRIRRAPYLIEGYDTENTVDAYHEYMTGTAGMLSKAKYAQEQFEHFRYAKPEVKRWAHRYIVDNLRNMGFADAVSGNMRALASFAYLGFKVSSMVINATQPWTLGIAELGRHTKRSAIWAIGKAQKDIISGKLSDSEKRLFASEIFKIQEQETAVHEMGGSREGATGKVSSFMHTLTDKALAPFQEVELLNRKTVILAAYRTFRADGLSRNEALEKALEVNRAVNFEMSRANLPGFAQKPLGRTVYALQSFMFNNWNWIYNRLTSGQKEDMIALLRYATAMAVIGGAAALPGGDELDKLYQHLFGESPKLALKKWSAKHAREYGSLGEMIHGFAWHGAASAAGVNISNAIRLQIPIVSPILSGDSLPEAAGGVFTGLVQKGLRAGTAASRGDIYRMVENIAPEALAGGMRAYRMATKGATTYSGKVLFDENGRPMKYNGLDAAKRMFGFQPSRVAERSEVTNAEIGIGAHWKEERTDLLAKLRISKPGADRKEVMLEIMRFNRRLRASQAAGLVPIIKADTVKRALSSRPNKRKMAWEQDQLT